MKGPETPIEAGDSAGREEAGVAVLTRVGDHDGGVHGQICSGPPTPLAP